MHVLFFLDGSHACGRRIGVKGHESKDRRDSRDVMNERIHCILHLNDVNKSRAGHKVCFEVVLWFGRKQAITVRWG